MTIVPMFKKCPRCKRRYSWNPDVGKMRCPYCGCLSGIDGEDMLWKTIGDILKRKKK